jgi:hypothetical protein
MEEVNITLAPAGIIGIVMDYIHGKNDILTSELESVGYSPTVKESWEDAALFASGGPDFTTMSALEASQLAAERDQNLVTVGRIHPQYMGWMVDTGGAYDPEQTGSIQSSVDKIVEDDALVGVGAWNGGDIPTSTITMSEAFGYDFSEGQDSDFNVTTADYVAIPELINQGELAAGSTSPEHGAAKFLTGDQEDFTKLFWGADIAKERGLGSPQLNSVSTSAEFLENNEEAVDAFLSAFQEGVDWFFEDPVGIVTESDEYIEMLAQNNADQAEYVLDWGFNLEYDLETHMMYENIRLDDDFISQQEDFLSYANDIGFVPDGYQDGHSFQAI